MYSSCAARPAEFAESTVARRRVVQPAGRPGRISLTQSLGQAKHQFIAASASLDDLGSTVTAEGSRRSKIIDGLS
jgi:hypothetical protein